VSTYYENFALSSKDITKGLRYNVDAEDVVTKYQIRSLGKEIADDPVAIKAYTRLGEMGVPINIDFGKAPVDSVSKLRIVGEYVGETIYLYPRNTKSTKELIEYLIHEGVHAERKSVMLGRTRYEEYLAFRRQLLYRDGRRPTLSERRDLWEWINKVYDLPVGKNPFGG
jgi:hypothetical protein